MGRGGYKQMARTFKEKEAIRRSRAYASTTDDKEE